MKELNDSVNPIVIRFIGYRQFSELLSLLSITVAFCGALLLDEAQRWTWILGCLLALLISLGFAFLFGRRAIVEFVYAEFEVTPNRLQALQAIEAPIDLLDCLHDLSPARFSGEQEYFSQLSSTLTAARCAELKDMIFKYTYAGRP